MKQNLLFDGVRKEEVVGGVTDDYLFVGIHTNYNTDHFYLSKDNGYTFNSYYVSDAMYVNTMVGSSDKKYIYCAVRGGSSSYLMKSDDYGSTFSQITVDNSNTNANGIDCSDNGQHIAIGYWTSVLNISNDYGQTWSNIYVSTIPAPAVSADGQYMYGGDWTNSGGRIYRSTDYGGSFPNSTTHVGYNTGTMICDLSGQYIVAGNKYGGSAYSTDYGVTFNTLVSGSYEYYNININDDGSVIAGTDESTNNVKFSLDYGSTFSEISSPFTSGTDIYVEIPYSGDYKHDIFCRQRGTALFYKMNSTHDGWDLVHTFGENVDNCVVTSNNIYVVNNTSNKLYKAKLSTLSFSHIYTHNDSFVYFGGY